MYSCNIKNTNPLTEQQLIEFKSNFSKMLVEREIEEVLVFDRDSSKTNFELGSSRISGIKHNDVYIQFVIVDEIQRDWLLYDDFGLGDKFKAGDLYYTNYRALIDIRTGKVLDVDREDDNEFHSTEDEALSKIQGVDW